MLDPFQLALGSVDLVRIELKGGLVVVRFFQIVLKS